MSAWIRGSEIAASLGLLDFEFAHEFVARGLQPHNGQGQPYMPAAVVNQFIQGLEQELAQHEDTASNLFWGDRDEIIANHIGPLQRRIQGYRLYLESFNGAVWEGCELPQDPDLFTHFMRALLNSLYQKSDAEKFFPALAKPAVIVPLQTPVKPRKLRPEQRHKIDCRAAAQKIWAESPEMTIDDMARRDEITNACEGHVYGKPALRVWINDLCPNRKPGRPKKKHT